MKTLKDIKKKDETVAEETVIGNSRNFSSLRESNSQEGEVVVAKHSKKKKIEETVVAQKVEAVEESELQETFDLGDKVKRKDGSEEGEVVQRKIEDKSVGGRYKLKLKNGLRSKWINGNALELVEGVEETETVETTTEDTPTEEVLENTSEQTETPMTDIYSAIVESVEKNREKRIYFENDDSTFVIDPSVSKIIKAVYEGLNRDNRKIMREKLNENLSSFCKVAYFSMCKLGKIDEEIK